MMCSDLEGANFKASPLAEAAGCKCGKPDWLHFCNLEKGAECSHLIVGSVFTKLATSLNAKDSK